MKKLADSIIMPKQFKTKATCHGIKYESVAVAEYEKKFGETKQCGLFVSVQYPWLGASPDRVVDDETIMEVKCPYVSRDQLINPLTVPYLQYEQSKLTLKKTSDYYFQIQGQLYCSERRLCRLVIFTLKDMQVVDVHRDDIFIDSMLQKLISFYLVHFHKALLERHVFHNQSSYF